MSFSAKNTSFSAEIIEERMISVIVGKWGGESMKKEKLTKSGLNILAGVTARKKEKNTSV